MSRLSRFTTIVLVTIFVLMSICSYTAIVAQEETPTPPQSETYIIIDPTGDDNGIGTLIYPTNAVFQKGVFDLTEVVIQVDEDYINFAFTFATLGGNPWNARNGFCLQYVHMYILTTNETLPVTNTTFGLNITIYYGWHYALLINGGWGTKPLPGTGDDEQLPAIYDANNALIAVEDNRDFDVYVDPESPNTISVRINRTLLVDTENIRDWKIVVAVASYDGYGPMRIRPIHAGDPDQWVFGGGDPNAILAGVHPGVVDLLAPTPEDQYVMLINWDLERRIPPLVGSIVVGTGELLVVPLITPPTLTPTPTPTPTPSPTPTPTPTPSPTPTPVTSPSPTPSPTPTPTPATSPSPKPTPTPAPEGLPTSLVAVLVIVIIIIIVILVVLLRKPVGKPK